MKMTRNFAVGSILSGAMAAANAAVDVTAVNDAVVDIATVGAAVFGVYVAIKLTKWVRRAL